MANLTSKTNGDIARWFTSPSFLSYLMVMILVVLLSPELNSEEPHPWLIITSAVVALGWPVVVNNSVLIPRLLYHQRTKRIYWIALLGLLFLATLVSHLAGEMLSLWQTPGSNPINSSFWSDFLGHTFFVLIAMSSKLTVEWFVSQRKIRGLEKEKYEVELDVLKNQINPHFLFNTLNNLYGLIMQDPPRSQEVVLKISALMRYNLYEGQKHVVPLEQEVNYIRNYLELQHLRSPSVRVQDAYSLTEAQAEIPPQLLLTVVENAFKHGFGSGVVHPFVTLAVRTDKRQIHFHLSNNYLAIEPKDSAHGIGLENTRRRLKLIYKDQFQLDMTRHADIFTVVLILPLRP